MINTIASSIVITIICLPALVAYKHPEVYKKIEDKLFILSLSITALIFAYDIGVWISNIKLRENPQVIDKELITKTLSNYQVPFHWLLIVFFGLFIYLQIISYFMRLFEEDRKNNKPKNKGFSE